MVKGRNSNVKVVMANPTPATTNPASSSIFPTRGALDFRLSFILPFYLVGISFRLGIGGVGGRSITLTRYDLPSLIDNVNACYMVVKRSKRL
jgi:hypothetical protein